MPKTVLVEHVNTPRVAILEADETGIFRFEAVLSEGDYVNRNRRMYPMEVLRSAFDAFIASPAREPGAVDHPDPYSLTPPSINDTGIFWESIRYEGNLVVGLGRIIETAKGLALKAVMQAGVQVGFSTRGYADDIQEEQLNGQTVAVVKNYELRTIDAVLAPSVRHARVRSYRQEQEEQAQMEELEKVKAQLAEAEASLTTAQAVSAELITARATIAAQEAELTELRTKVAEAEAAQQVALVEAAITSAIGNSQFDATIRSELDALKEIGVGITVENAATLVNRFKSLVEGAASAGNNNVEGEPRGSVNESEDVAEQKNALSEDELEELRAAGL